jgi:hypothetical protein|tara:strand:- start:4176 stop:4301 length:126 start_codon:yes stop_codon:yes gene_type:complete
MWVAMTIAMTPFLLWVLSQAIKDIKGDTTDDTTAENTRLEP